MATSSRTIEGESETGLDLPSEAADKFVCFLFCAATLLGAAWFYSHVMCSAQRALWRLTALRDARALQIGEQRMFTEAPRRMGFAMTRKFAKQLSEMNVSSTS